jgi:hypothetical protein
LHEQLYTAEPYKGESYKTYILAHIESCIEKIHRMVNPEFNDICETVEAFEREEE